LDKANLSETEEVEPKVNYYNDANKQVAILCNHQKTVSKSFAIQTEKMQEIVINPIQTKLYLHIFTYIYIYLHIFTYIYIYLHIFT